MDTISNLGSNHLVLKSLRENVLRVVCCFKGFDSPIVQRFGSAGGCFFFKRSLVFKSLLSLPRFGPRPLLMYTKLTTKNHRYFGRGSGAIGC